MALFSGLVRPIQAHAPHDDFWYQPLGTASAAGVRVSEETAMKTSAVWACVRVIARTIGSVPLIVYEQRGDGGRERARHYYLYDVLHDSPNDEQTPLEFREMLTRHCLLRGNGYARIVPGRRGFAHQLVPLHPDLVEPERLESGRIVYRVRQPGGFSVVYNDEDIFHLRGVSADGLKGMSVLECARESIGLALATEQYGARLFAQNARPGGILKHKGALSKEASAKLKLSWEQAHSGVANAHRVAVLEEGMEWQQVGMTNEDAQFLATREFQVSDIARWFGVPLHMIQETSKQTSWGSGIESLGLGFVIYTLLPWATLWEQTIRRDLIVETNRYYAEHLFDALTRADIKTRYDAYAVGRQWGWLSVNDIRRRENDDPVVGGDVYLEPLNMREAGTIAADPDVMMLNEKRAAQGLPPIPGGDAIYLPASLIPAIELEEEEEGAAEEEGAEESAEEETAAMEGM